IVGVEAAVVAGLITWSFVHPHKTTPATSFGPPPINRSYKTPHITPVSYAKGLATPTSIAATGALDDARIFVTERAGTIRAVSNKGVVSSPQLDITNKVLNSGEMGLLGLAFHPKYPDNHYFYVYYINTAKQSVVARYTMDPATNVANPASEKILLTLQQSYPNHKGGQLQFGADGYLYIAIGDGGSAGDPGNHGQDLTNWFGKILRIDVDHGDPYSVPATNPFVHTAAAKPEIWAYGLRNPWRFSFDSKTKDLYIADVGQDKYEELDVQSAGSKGGENYGWRCYEGLHEFNAAGCKAAGQYVKPVLEYTHDNKRCSITGGYVYRGSAEPSLAGKYFYADYCSGDIMYTSKQGGQWQQPVVTASGNSISTFGQDTAGELFYADGNSGEIFRITDTAN
ncbi:MAG TPA: PQQ-dependent sugar dehydrogenase, partial [Candidatus Saccharimonadales bacterium]|nr:PQQ-dependent sugar dehydrogenase [Candidatus Saccharimonadales bacterium]